MNVEHRTRDLRRQLINLLDQVRKESGLEPPPPRIAASLTHDFLDLLRDPHHQSIGLRWRLVSHAHLHRHIFCIRCPDQAFYLDAIKGYFLRRNIQPLERHILIARMTEGQDGYTLTRGAANKSQNGNFMLITLHVSATLLPNGRRLARDLKALLHAVELSVNDFPAMHAAVEQCAQKLRADSSEAAALLRWMNKDKYIYHGMQWHEKRVGLLRNKRTTESIIRGFHEEIELLPPPREPGLEWLHLHAPQQHAYSTVNMECVRICWREGKRLASLILLGHFSRNARHANASYIPLLRTYWESLLAQPLLRQSAFYRREIRTIFDRLPKPLLLSVPAMELLEPMVEIANLTGPTQTHTALFRPGPNGLHLLLAAMPADRFGPNVLHRIFRHLRDIDITEHAYQDFSIGAHRLLLIACTCQGKRSNGEKVAQAVQEAVLFWKDAARAEILGHAGELDIPAALAELEQLPFLYQNLFPPERLIDHMKARDWVIEHGRIHVRVRNLDKGVELDIFSPAPLPLGELVATVQGFGLVAQQEEVVSLEKNHRKVHLSNLYCTTKRTPHPEDIGRLTLGLDRVLNGEADDESANALVLMAGLDIQQVTVIIALRNHLVQLLADAAPTPLTNMLRHHPMATAKLYRMFEARHRAAMPENYEEQAKQEFEKALEGVKNLTDDRWFRALAELVHAGVRTNAYARNPWEPVAIKIDPHLLSYTPKPVPYREIFVHGVHVEGVHLRGGPIARGGLRFSDRLSDFRTEVLELMATQVTKNSLIVPTGAKGGFIVRHGKQRSEPFVQEQYRAFIRALLSLTDNMVRGEFAPPAGIRIPQEDLNDAYLVVAADKGTARYSDSANEEARLAGFWLDDAFASGGRHGYDHKA
ncbi:MAG TPA: NAD-glutamate dehydrogenase domain-containing protein, partial [Mariprofundaceae bacterium]|nr:NAD-glutamate dehydrogenase domain-containing protein [Mariprofundaceae bacterium]